MLRKNRRPLRLERLEDRVTPTSNILVTTHSGNNFVIDEVTSEGTLVRTLTPPVNSGTGSRARDIVLAGNGDIHLFNGTFTPQMSTWHAATNTWTDLNASNWSTVNAGGYGGVARWGNY